MRRAGPRRFGDEADRAGGRGNVGVTFPLEAAKNGRHADAGPIAALQEIFSGRGVTVARVGRMELNGGNAQLLRDFEMHAQSRVNRRKDSDRPFFHEANLVGIDSNCYRFKRDDSERDEMLRQG